MIIVMPKAELGELVMRRVRFIYLVRTLVTPLVAEVISLSACVGAFVVLVSFEDVVANARATESFLSLVQYVFSAAMHTELLMQTLFIIFIAVSSYCMYSIIKMPRQESRTFVESQIA